MNPKIYVPEMLTLETSSLTLHNWTIHGINVGSFNLEQLLFKPGLEFLQTISTLKAYVGNYKKIAVYIPSKLLETQKCILRSPYDGTLQHITPIKIYHLLEKLQPEIIIAPNLDYKIINDSPKILTSTIFTNLLNPYTPKKNDAIYLAYGNVNFIDFIKEITEVAASLLYLKGNFEFFELKVLKGFNNIKYIESNKPMQDALQAKIYYFSKSKTPHTFSLIDSIYANQHEVIDITCQCSTCVNKLTKAYLHHLFQHTPLLAKRLIIQHNAFTYSSYINQYDELR